MPAISVKDAFLSFGKRNSMSPIGSIVAWHKSFANTPALTAGWVECNGQTLSDSNSVYDGQVIPDLNGDARFLRGSGVSGIEQTEDFLAHTHENNIRTDINLTAGGTEPVVTSGATATGLATVSSGGSETRPINMSVVWIIRIK